MSTIRLPEIPTRYGAIDTSSLAGGDGVYFDAALGRAIALSANRLAAKQHTAVGLIWDGDPSGLDQPTLRDIRAFGGVQWTLMDGFREIPIFKKPGLSKLEIQGFQDIDVSGDQIQLQFVTKGDPFNAHAVTNDRNVLTMTGTGALTVYSISGIRLLEGTDEALSIYSRGVVTTRLGATGTYGTPNPADIVAIRGGPEHSEIECVTSGGAQPAWNTTGNTWATGGHVCFLTNSNGDPFAGPLKIFEVRDMLNAATKSLHVTPGVSLDVWHTATTNGAAVNRAKVYIYDVPKFRLVSLSAVCSERTA